MKGCVLRNPVFGSQKICKPSGSGARTTRSAGRHFASLGNEADIFHHLMKASCVLSMKLLLTCKRDQQVFFFLLLLFYAPNFEEVGGAYWFRPVRPSVRLPVRPSVCLSVTLFGS